MTSRFFASDSESSESESEEEIIETRQEVRNMMPSDDEEETKRVVRSAKEKRYDEINNIIKNIKNYKKNKDLSNLYSSYEDLVKAFTKAKPVIDKEEGGKVPRFFIRCVAELEDYINQAWEERDTGKKANKSKGLPLMRQKLRKYVKNFEQELKTFRENPDEDDSDLEAAEEEDMLDDDASEDMGFTAKNFKKETSVVSSESRSEKLAAAEQDDEDSDYSDWGMDSESSSSESEAGGTILLREKFLKKSVTKEEEEVKKKKKEEKAERKKETKVKEGDGAWETVKKGGVVPSEKPKMFSKDDDINVKSVVAKLSEILAARGKKGTDRKEQIELVHELQGIAKEHNLGEPVYIKMQYHLIMSIFDYTRSGLDAMKPDIWDKSLKKIDEMLQMLLRCDNVSMNEPITDETESLEEAPYKIIGDAMTIIERMDEEFVKLVKASDAHSNDYILKLRHEVKVCRLIDTMIKYQEKQGHVPDVCRVYLRKIEHMYYKYDQRAADMVNNRIPHENNTSLDTMEKLCTYIYKRDTTDRLRTRAVLCNIYHMALHDRWFKARDFMLMVHLQDTIQHADLPTQILYNRTMVQLGLCGFRHGQILEAHNCLVDIQSGGRAKELLAQGLLPQRQYERTAEQEKMEKNRQIPFHMHINLELLECVYLVSAMLIEIPYMAAHEFDARRRMISKSFHHQLKNSERQALIGHPESMREHVVAASKAMRRGDWRTCQSLLLNEKMNTKVWDLFHNANDVREMLGKKVQEESLRTYLFTHSHVYDSISLTDLTSMFELPHPKVHAIISKMIINEEVMGSLDEPTQCLVMHKTEPSQLQSLSLQIADKLHSLVENNDRVLDQKPFFQRNAGGFRDRNNKWGGQEKWGGQGGRDHRQNDDRRGNRGGNDYHDRRNGPRGSGRDVGDRADRGRNFI